ncbi:MAG: hypothetical protein ACRDE5_08100, partial [Ginsengibacter sp.]
MKKIILLVALFTFLHNVNAQKTGDILKQQAGAGVKEGAAIATETTANKVTDKVLNSIFSKKNKKKKDKTTQSSDAATNNTNSNAATNSATANSVAVNNPSDASLQTYSKYDFIPGEKVLAYEDFAQDAVGEFPLKWNTNSSGEIVTASGQTGNWLMINKKGLFMPEFINNLPDNFTLEYDLIYSGSDYLPFLQLLLLSTGNGKDGKQ